MCAENNWNGTKNRIALPAYNAAKTLERTLAEIPPEYREHIILVDDASEDNTFEIEKTFGLIVVEHPVNRGYGGNQKTCCREALKLNADIVVMLHPDHQYDASMLSHLTRSLLNREAD